METNTESKDNRKKAQEMKEHEEKKKNGQLSWTESRGLQQCLKTEIILIGSYSYGST